MQPTSRKAFKPDYANRVQAVRGAMDVRGLDCLLLCDRNNIRYLFGFTGSNAWAIITPEGSSFFTDSRYNEQAHTEVVDCDIHIAARGLPDTAATQLRRCGSVSVGFESDTMTVSTLRTLEKTLHEAAPDLVLVPLQQMVESVRAVKEESEIAAISAASVLLDGAIEHARKVAHVGMTEQELAWQIERWLREHGSGPMPFPPIVAAGPHCAHPHASPGNIELGPGEPILIDIGAVVDGYCSDLSRTLFAGQPNEEIERVYFTVLKAQQSAIDGIHAGMTAPEADACARDVIRNAGYGNSFGHGLGHGVGLAIHERPTLSSLSRDVLKEDMVFTVEPGIYLPGLGGVRIEDTVVLRGSGVQQLTRSGKRDPVCASC